MTVSKRGDAADSGFALVVMSLAGGDATVARQSFHHLTPYSLGVLSDVALGGMRRDLTTEIENFSTSTPNDTRLYTTNNAIASGAEPWWNALSAYYNRATGKK